MNKKLFALAIVSAASAASAQSSLTLYGVVDASVESGKAGVTVTRVSTDNLASSGFGQECTEDLGGGLKEVFNLEASLKTDTGAADSSRFFGRQAWVGVSGGFGELRLGRTDSSIGALVGNSSILGAQEYDDFKIAGTWAGGTYRRVDNAVTYVMPKLVEGLSAQVQYATNGLGAEASGDKTGRLYGLNTQYTSGAFGAGLGYLYAKADAAGDKRNKARLVYLSYDFGAAKLTGYYNRDSSSDTAFKSRRLWGARVDVPLGSAFNLQASVSRAEKSPNVDNDKATIVALKGIYSLSKRTSVYALATTVSNDDNVNYAVGGVVGVNGERSSGLAVGVSHKF